ncbi:MAG: D-alanine--D-alanine ligase [Coriobacteriales bacterium]|nr:D-alanine--D-alanine ligase [Coriobacteriales bacterium]
MAQNATLSNEEGTNTEESPAPVKRSYVIALLCGGAFSEREVSLASAENVQRALISAGHRVIKIDTANPRYIPELQRIKPDVAFIALHGKHGEDGTPQAILEAMGIPYTGSGVLGSALAMDKYRSKLMYEALGLKTPASLYLKKHERNTAAASVEHILSTIKLPVVVKPSDDGSSVGISIVREKAALRKALQQAYDAGSSVLVEQYVTGTEITVAVLGSTKLTALPVIEIIPKNDFYDYESKYAKGGSEHLIPARISEDAQAKASHAALLAHEGLGCFGVSRTDMIIDNKDNAWVIETNTIPGMTSVSLLPDAARYAGISNQELYEQLVLWALERAQSE